MIENKILETRQWYEKIEQNVTKVFFGKEEVIKKILIAILSKGHVLLEDVPGVGKTILARAIANSIEATFSRIQCTPDLLPADILGVSIYNPKESNFTFHKGPIFANIVLVDEINRATPRTQAALLEAMGENQVSIEGKMLKLPEPFLVIATENPVEFEGTFPLPEAQKDRFLLSCKIGYPDRKNEKKIFESQKRLTHPVLDLKPVTDIQTINKLQEWVVNVFVDEKIVDYMMELIDKTRVSPYLSLGISPRGALALYRATQALALISGREYVIPEDVKELFISVCSKRVILKPDSLIKGISSEEVLNEILNTTEVPVLKELK